jgi:hypothetical protein
MDDLLKTLDEAEKVYPTLVDRALQAWFEEWKADQLGKGPKYFELLRKHQETMRRLNTEEMLKGQAFGL